MTQDPKQDISSAVLKQLEQHIKTLTPPQLSAFEHTVTELLKARRTEMIEEAKNTVQEMARKLGVQPEDLVSSGLPKEGKRPRSRRTKPRSWWFDPSGEHPPSPKHGRRPKWVEARLAEGVDEDSITKPPSWKPGTDD